VISREHVDDSPRAAQEERVEEGQHEHADAADAPADAAVAPVHGWDELAGMQRWCFASRPGCQA
jgi:hypothetical protein